VLEHVPDQRAAVREWRRVLKPGGWLFLSTPNRFSLGPDPHAGLWMGGWLPSALVARYIRRRGGIPPRRRLLSAGRLRRLLRDAALRNVRLAVPAVTAAQRAAFGGPVRVLAGVHNRILTTGVGRSALLRLGPTLLAVAQR
jgi:SAM-dependent methyltransferase